MYKPEQTRQFEYIDSTCHRHRFFVGRTGGSPAYSAIEEARGLQGVGDSEIVALTELMNKIEEIIYRDTRLIVKPCRR